MWRVIASTVLASGSCVCVCDARVSLARARFPRRGRPDMASAAANVGGADDNDGVTDFGAKSRRDKEPTGRH